MKVVLSDIYDDERRTVTIGRVSLWWPFPVAWMLGSSAARVLGWPLYGADAPAWIRWLGRQFCHIRDGKWWLYYRLHPKHRYHVVRTGLRPGYHDTDKVMLHACMALLRDYVEIEHGGADKLAQWAGELQDPAEQDPNAPPSMEAEQGRREAEVVAIYRWWMEERPKDKARRAWLMEALYGGGRNRLTTRPVEGNDKLAEIVLADFSGDDQKLFDEFCALENKITSDEQAMLHRLVNIRQGLWT